MTRAFCVAALLAAAVPLSAQRGPAASSMSTVPPEILALACAPAIAYDTPPMPLHLTGGQDAFVRRNYAPGDLVTINAGTQNGITVGQEFFIRRVQTDRSSVSRATPGMIRTAGWLRVYAVDDAMSLATIEHACDSIEVGDYLEPFVLPQMPSVSNDKPKAERDNYARVMAGVDLRRSFGKGDFFTIDRGSSQGVSPGTQFVVYRDKHAAQNFLFELGDAVAVDVRQDTSTLQVTLSRDAFAEGDYVAQRK